METSLYSASGFNSLMRHHVSDILLVSSLYDSFLLAKDGQLQEQMVSEYMKLNLWHMPGLVHTPSATEAIALAQADPNLNLILTTMNVGDMHCIEFAKRVHDLGLRIPVVLLAFDHRELKEFLKLQDLTYIDRVFVWQGDFRILLSIVKYVEDRWNVRHDTREVGVEVLILVEDNIRFYSSYLPLIYTELMKHSHRILKDGRNTQHKLLRMRARPKILLCDNYEEAMDYYLAYEDNVLGVITDVEFPRNGKKDPAAGEKFAKFVKNRRPHTPIMMQSFQPLVKTLAMSLGVKFARKNSPTLLQEVRQFMIKDFGFGDFEFEDPPGIVIDSAKNLRQLVSKLAIISDACLQYHAERNHFSTWLRARTEFGLAESIKPKSMADFEDVAGMRAYLLGAFHDYQILENLGQIADFDVDLIDEPGTFLRIGSGSLGGKARGMAFLNYLLKFNPIGEGFDNVIIGVPRTVVICTDYFDQYLDDNNLKTFVVASEDENEVRRRIMAGKFPEDLEDKLRMYLTKVDQPLAVRSSSQLEDSQYFPFAGIYDTRMVSNTIGNIEERLEQLLDAIRHVYMSAFTIKAKRYMSATMYRLEEEKMAVMIQRVTGEAHGDRFYPHLSGVARSHNFYPTAPMVTEDGVANIALGLGKTVADCGSSLRFCPKYPKKLMSQSTTQDILNSSQKKFFGVDLSSAEAGEVEYDLEQAYDDGVLKWMGSVYSPENDRVYDSVERDGIKVITFAPILKQGAFPLPDLVQRVLELGQIGMSGPIEIEFAVNLKDPKNKDVEKPADNVSEFAILQLRPIVMSRELEQVELVDTPTENLICSSDAVLGVGKLDGIFDVLFVDIDAYDRGQSRAAADEIGELNAQLIQEQRPYLLITLGRLGSLDPWLGIPVRWEQISGARAIVESGFKDFKVEPSQGSHFFQNLSALGIGYFTINQQMGNGHIDWSWLQENPSLYSGTYVKHLQFEKSVVVIMSGSDRTGIITKPGFDQILT